MAKVVPRLIFWDDRTCPAQMTPENNGVRINHIRSLPLVVTCLLSSSQCFHIHFCPSEQFGM